MKYTLNATKPDLPIREPGKDRPVIGGERRPAPQSNR